MKTTIIILLAEEYAGKSETIKKLAGLTWHRKPVRIRINGKIIWIYRHGSPQEQEDFCHIGKVKDNIKRRIERCQKSHGEAGFGYKDMTVIIPFTIKRNRTGNLNKKCIINPIKWLKNKGYIVKVVYLEKRDKALDKLISKVKQNAVITSYENEEQR